MKTLLLLLHMPFTIVLLQSVEIIPITNDNGVTFIRMDERKIVERYIKTLNIVNVTQYHEVMDTLFQTVKALKMEPKKELWFMKEINNLNNKLRILTPTVVRSKRMRRGLINFLGNTIKFVTGNMDSEDAKEIYEHLQNLDMNTKQLTDYANNQIIINDNLIKEMNDIVKNVNDQKHQIKNYLSDIEHKTKYLEKTEITLQLYVDIASIEKILTKFEDIILLSNLNVLAHDILTIEEIEKYNVTIETMPFIKSNVLFEKDLIIFVISIPEFTKEKYFDTLIVPFPNSKNEQLDTEILKVIIHKNEIFEYKDKILKKKDLKTHDNNCIRNIHRQNNTCHFKINNEQLVKEINEEIVITNNLQKTKVDQNCIEQEIFIKGNTIIKFSNCRIKINNFTFCNVKVEEKNNVIIPLLGNTNMKRIVNNLTLKDVHSNVIKNQKTISYVKNETNKANISSIIIINLLVVSILTIVIIFVTKRVKDCLSLKKLRRLKNELKEELEVLPTPIPRSSKPISGTEIS